MSTYPAPFRNMVMLFMLLSLGAMFIASFQSLMENHTVKETRSRGNVSTPPEGMPATPPAMGKLPEGDTNLAMTEQQADDITELMRKLQTNPNDTEALIALGDIFMTAQEWARAEVFLTRAMVSKPAETKPRYMLGICQYRQDKMKDAAKTFEDLIAINEDPAVMFNLAVIYKHHLGQADKAKELLHKIIDSAEADTDTIGRAREELTAP